MKTKSNLSFYLWLFAISAIILCLDQISKNIISKNLNLYQTKVFIPDYWNWTFIYNKGSAFGFLAKENGWQNLFLSLIAILVIMIIIYYLVRGKYSLVKGMALSFIVGGALGNLCDRIFIGKVIDFIQLHYHAYYWPAFNLADSFISIGITLLIIESILFSNKK